MLLVVGPVLILADYAVLVVVVRIIRTYWCRIPWCKEVDMTAGILFYFN